MQPFLLNLPSYEKIAESPADWDLSESDHRSLSKVPWVVTEKIHGANFVILTDGVEAAFAKRKALLEPDEEFFGYQILSARLKESTAALFASLRVMQPGLTAVIVYGELFGGSYPHPSVPADPRVEAVQTGIYYTPTIEYCVFDVALGSWDAPPCYLDFDVAMKQAAAGFFVSEALFVGSFQKALAYPLGFQSPVPKRLGLPALSDDNKAEGVVLKPVRTIEVAMRGGTGRPILKRKIPQFVEDSRFQQARKWKKVVGPAWAEEQSAIRLLQEEIGGWLCAPRLHNAVSKIGRVNPGDQRRRRELTETLVRDILDEIELQHPDLWSMLSSPAQLQLEQEIRNGACALAEACLRST